MSFRLIGEIECDMCAVVEKTTASIRLESETEFETTRNELVVDPDLPDGWTSSIAFWGTSYRCRGCSKDR